MTRTRTYLTLAALWLSCIPSFAQPAPPTPEPAPRTICPPVAKTPTTADLQQAMAKAQDHGLLWRLRKDGKDLYLFGTMHVGKLDWAFPGPLLTKALQASDTIALELDLQDPQVLSALKAAMDRMPPLPVDAALQSRLDQQADSACLPRNAMAAVPPLFQALGYLVLAARDDGLDQAYASEHMLIGYAKKAGKPIVSLETPAIQIRALTGSDAKLGQQLLEETLNQLEQHKVAGPMRRMAHAWANSRLDDLESYEAWCDCIDSDADRVQLHRMVFDRNPQLADRIASEHASGKHILAAVGALHLVGPQGLPQLLAAKGFSVELLLGRR